MRMFPAGEPSGMVMGGGAGAPAGSFLVPLITGIGIVSVVLTAAVALSPSEEEILGEAELMDRIGKLRSEA